MPDSIAQGPRLQCIQIYPEPTRRCICGCGRSLTGKRADARTYDASCRSRVARDEARRRADEASRPELPHPEPPRQRCRCAAGALATVDPDGDLVCSKCGRFRAHVEARIRGFDTTAHQMVTDADGHLYRPARKRRPAPWRVEAIAA